MEAMERNVSECPDIRESRRHRQREREHGESLLNEWPADSRDGSPTRGNIRCDVSHQSALRSFFLGAVVSSAATLLSACVTAQSDSGLGFEIPPIPYGQWVELPGRGATRVSVSSNSSAKRVFVSPVEGSGPHGLPRFHMRYDLPSKRGVATEVHSIELDCWRGETYLLGLQRYDEHLNQTVSVVYDPESAKPERILNFYDASLTRVCSGEYRFRTRDDFLAALRALEAREQRLQKSTVEDRAIPVPGYVLPAGSKGRQFRQP